MIIRSQGPKHIQMLTTCVNNRFVEYIRVRLAVENCIRLTIFVQTVCSTVAAKYPTEIMNCLIIVVVTFSVMFSVSVAQNEETIDTSSMETTDGSTSNSESAEDVIGIAESLFNSAYQTGQQMYSSADGMTKEQEEELSKAMGEMVTYFSKSIKDMSDIMEVINSASEDNGEAIQTNLVNNLMSYVDDTEMMRSQIGRMMSLRAQFQNSILKRLYDLPISTEDAVQLENDLREQIRLRAGKMADSMQNIPGMSQMMPQMSQLSQMTPKISSMSQIPQKFIPSFN